jgi:RHH-type rel operon transcriptional repressor/antitoxin RelB
MRSEVLAFRRNQWDSLHDHVLLLWCSLRELCRCEILAKVQASCLMLTVALDPDIERRLSELAKRTGRSMSDFARELIEGNIEDLEDRYLAEQAIAEGGPRLTSDQVRKELGLER